jgi:hypothetical protein
MCSAVSWSCTIWKGPRRPRDIEQREGRIQLSSAAKLRGRTANGMTVCSSRLFPRTLVTADY